MDSLPLTSDELKRLIGLFDEHRLLELELRGLPLLMEGLSPFGAFRHALLLTLANPVFTGILFCVTIALIGVSLLTTVPMILVTPVWVSSVGVIATRTLILKYEAVQRLNAEGNEPELENS